VVEEEEAEAEEEEEEEEEEAEAEAEEHLQPNKHFNLWPQQQMLKPWGQTHLSSMVIETKLMTSSQKWKNTCFSMTT